MTEGDLNVAHLLVSFIQNVLEDGSVRIVHTLPPRDTNRTGECQQNRVKLIRL